jgi:hypothetical protein
MVVVSGREGRRAKLPECLVMLHEKFERRVCRVSVIKLN